MAARQNTARHLSLHRTRYDSIVFPDIDKLLPDADASHPQAASHGEMVGVDHHGQEKGRAGLLRGRELLDQEVFEAFIVPS